MGDGPLFALLPAPLVPGDSFQKCISNLYMGVSKNRGKTPQIIPCLIGVSLIFTIHFGGKTPQIIPCLIGGSLIFTIHFGGKTPQIIPCLIGFSLIFTIHFGGFTTPMFGSTPLLRGSGYLVTGYMSVYNPS